MGYKYDEKAKTWIAHFCKRHPKTGTPISMRRQAKSEAAAKKVERDLIFEVERRCNAESKTTWIQEIDAYVETCRARGMSGSHIYNTEKALKRLTVEKWGDRHLDTVLPQEIRELIDHDMADNSPHYRKNIAKGLRAVLNHAFEAGHLERSPMPDLKFKLHDKIRTGLTREEVTTLLNKAKETGWQWYPHLAFALYTGLRNGELFALRWDKVNLENRQIVVDCSWNSKDGFKSTKSGDDRIVEIAEELVPLVQRLKLQRGECPFVLPRLTKWRQGEQARELRMFLLAIGLPRITFHDLRATWATIMLGNGVEPVKVMMMGGWKDMKTMMIYFRKAGLGIKGITSGLRLHDPTDRKAQVLNFPTQQA